MQLTPESLSNHGFVLHEKVKHTQFSTFLSKHRWQGSKLHLIYLSVCFLLVILNSLFIILSLSPAIYCFTYSGLGVVLAIFLIPLHEYIHLLTYKYFGAKKVAIKTFLKRRYVLTHADQFVVSKREIKWIALMPFIALSMSGLSILWFVDDLWQVFISAFLLFHVSLCHADFLILDYFLSSKDETAMFDDLKNDVTYIFKKSNQ